MLLFVYGLSYKTRRENLLEIFSPYGVITTSRIIVDPQTRRSRGYGFVQMDDEGGARAMEALDGTEYMGRTIHVALADDRRKIERRERSEAQLSGAAASLADEGPIFDEDAPDA